MSSESAQRFRSGDICLATGRYQFDGYVDGLAYSTPPPTEMRVSLATGDTFPTSGAPARACYWRLVEGAAQRPQELHAASEM